MEFPVYRKYKNNKHFFKLISANEFEELSFIGKKLIITPHKATILPDRNFMFDLLNDIGHTCELSTAEEYEYQLNTTHQINT